MDCKSTGAGLPRQKVLGLKGMILEEIPKFSIACKKSTIWILTLVLDFIYVNFELNMLDNVTLHGIHYLKKITLN